MNRITEEQRSIGLKVRTNVRAGHHPGGYPNHNQTVIRSTHSGIGLKVRSNLKAGGISVNHNQAVVGAAHGVGLKVRTNVQAGGRGVNHNQTMVRSTHPIHRHIPIPSSLDGANTRKALSNQ